MIRCKGIKTTAQSKALCAHNPTDRAGTGLGAYDYDVILDPSSTVSAASFSMWPSCPTPPPRRSASWALG